MNHQFAALVVVSVTFRIIISSCKCGNLYEYDRQLYEHDREQWQYQSEHQKEEHEQQQELVENNQESFQKNVSDGNRRIQEGDENFHETFESNREKGAAVKSFGSKRNGILGETKGKRITNNFKKIIIMFKINLIIHQ